MDTYPPGARIAGRYEVAGRPLMGGMGIVYLCFDHGEQRPVALKTFRPEFLPDREARDRFLREGTTWVNLGRHPHIVRCYQVIQPGVGLEVYLVLELVAKEEGCADASLRSWLTPGRPLPVKQALLFALQIARGMAHATATIPGFVHRDLKPENVLVGADRLSNADVNRLRVTDFGLAAVLQETGSKMLVAEEGTQGDELKLGRTQLTRGIVGTPLYMAPEQWKGERVDVQADVYALGCILYEMLAGQRVVKGKSLAALEQAHCAGKLRPLPVGQPEAVGDVVARCLVVEPGARYAGWEALEEALVAAYAEVTGHAAPRPEPVEALGRAEGVTIGWSCNTMGVAYMEIGKAEIAKDYFERARDVGQEEGERRLEMFGGANLGNVYFWLGDTRQAIGFYEQALAIAREIGDRHTEGQTLSNLGVVYKNLGDMRRAIEYYEEALATAREIGDRHAEGQALGNLGITYRNLGDTQRAIGFHEQTLVISRDIGDRLGEGEDLENLGSAYFQRGDIRRAIGYYEQALMIRRDIGDRRGEGNVLSNLGLAYADLGDAQRAISYFEQGLAIGHETGDVVGVATNSIGMAFLYAGRGELGQALPLAQQAAQIFERIGSPKVQVAQQLIAQIRAALR